MKTNKAKSVDDEADYKEEPATAEDAQEYIMMYM
jgi:hypothetical protein